MKSHIYVLLTITGVGNGIEFTVMVAINDTTNITAIAIAIKLILVTLINNAVFTYTTLYIQTNSLAERSKFL